MHRPERVPAATAALVAAALALAACGDSTTETAADTTHDHNSGHGEHALFEVPDGEPAPTIEIEVEPDPVAGVNIHVAVTDFEPAPEKASTEPESGEGHFHAYVDGEKVARFYNRSIHLPLPEGDHLVMVELSANDHSTYAVDGEPISAQVEVTVPTPPGGHQHQDPVEAAEPAPTIDLAVTPDPKSGWNVKAAVENLTFAPRSAGLDHTDGEGHLHLSVDGKKVSRLYGEWWHLDPLPAGEHEIMVEATANNHRPYSVDGQPVTASVTIDVTEEQATGSNGGDHDDEAGHGGDGDEGHDHDEVAAAAAAQSLLSMPAAEADTVIEIDVADGSVERDDTRFVVEEGSTVGLIVTTDAVERVHVHGYEFLVTTGPDAPVEIVFTADSPGVFEVELEDSGLFLFDLQVG